VEPNVNPVRNTWTAVQDHARLFESFAFVYPVISRRSRGLSLGVNLNPDKRCNFDCVYCEVDRRTPGRSREIDIPLLRAELTALVQAALRGELAVHPRFAEAPQLTRIIRDIAFSGDGEPTLIPNFAACVQAVVEVKLANRLGDTRIVLITDAAGLDKADVRHGLALMDAHQGEVWAKLDAGTPDYFRAVNRSHVAFDRILKNLRLTARVRPTVIQSLFLKLHGAPLPLPELHAYCDRLNELRHDGAQIREVHAYTIARPTPEPWATRLEPGELDAIAQTIRDRTGLSVLAFP
jgi:wyosine [tRNA(Phe)-imidazoG37] synthetase (radical SAM superfamily)